MKKSDHRNEHTPRGVTMEAVGRLAGVSQVTVSRALSDPSKVSAKTMAKIREAIALTGYVPNALAGALASNKSRLISALVPSITNPVYSTLVQTFAAGMRNNGYQIMLSECGFAPEDEEELVSAHLSRRPDAMLLTGIHHSARTRRMLLGAGIPIVEVWDITDSPIDFCVGFSHVETGHAVADFMYSKGFRIAGTVSAGDERARRRMMAFAERFEKHGGNKVQTVIFDDQASLALGRAGLAKLMDEKGLTSGAIFCSSDLLAHGVLTEAYERGLKIPEDIAIVGFGDQDFSAFTAPSLTTVRVDRAAFGTTAAATMLQRLDGKEADQKVVNLGFEIIERNSTRSHG